MYCADAVFLQKCNPFYFALTFSFNYFHNVLIFKPIARTFLIDLFDWKGRMVTSVMRRHLQHDISFSVVSYRVVYFEDIRHVA